MIAPTLILDTNVCDKLLSPSPQYDVERIRKRIRKEFRSVVSPQSFIELLRAFKGGKTEEHFKTDKERIRLLVGNGTPIFLRLPGAFALWTVLRLDTPVPRLTPSNFERWFRVVLAAKGRDHLFGGGVKLRLSRKSFWINPDVIELYHEEGIRTHQVWLQDAKSRNYQFPTRRDWANRIGKALDRELNTEEAELLGDGLEAAYEYQRQSFETALTNSTLNIGGHNGDWIDNQQLFYLCDPAMHLMTDDEGIKKKSRNARQCERVLLLNEF